MSTPVPHIDPLPGPIEVEARGDHAAEMRAAARFATVTVTDAEILAAWDGMTPDARRIRLDVARERIRSRAAETLEDR